MEYSGITVVCGSKRCGESVHRDFLRSGCYWAYQRATYGAAGAHPQHYVDVTITFHSLYLRNNILERRQRLAIKRKIGFGPPRPQPRGADLGSVVGAILLLLRFFFFVASRQVTTMPILGIYGDIITHEVDALELRCVKIERLYKRPRLHTQGRL